MAYRFSIAPLTALPLDPLQLIELAAATGLDGVGLRLIPVTEGGVGWPLASDRPLMRRTLAKMAETGVQIVDIELVKLTPGFRVDDVAAFLDAGAELGAQTVIAQGYDADRTRVADNYARLCERAGSMGLRVDLEFPSWIEVGDFAGAAGIVAQVSPERGGLIIDALHLFRSGGQLADVAAAPRSWFEVVQLCDAPLAAPPSRDEVIRFAREARLAPGEGELPLAALMRALPDDLWVSIETPDLAYVARHGHEALVRRALAATRAVVAQV